MTEHPQDLPRHFVEWTHERPLPPWNDVSMTTCMPVDQGRSYYLVGEPGDYVDITSIGDTFVRQAWFVRRRWTIEGRTHGDIR